ncbi:MAG TPA: hypothetical protein DET40_13225 [Lentisphaeria bacterium]|nr:MAG: hypothetical protein A2X45_04675 [Lentisphaerae bacterium GWF2_50_93]HCE44502.1 hypothetical protein [Lentisphaeria bacterium]
MTIIYILFEFLVIGLFLGLLANSLRKRKVPDMTVMILSMGTVIAGELVNNFVSKVTVYNSSFLIWIPGTQIPVFIICGGIVVSLLLFMIANRISNKSVLKKCMVVVFLSASFPLAELAGIGCGLWKWPSNPPLDLGWIIGVWEFYFIFIGLPALIGCIVSVRFKGNKNSQKD